MKKFLVVFIAILVVLGIMAGGVWYHFYSLDKLQNEIVSINHDKENAEQIAEEIKNGLLETVEEQNNILDKLDKYVTTSEEITIDSAVISEEIKNIGELATTEYRYTNAGVLENEKKILWVIPSNKNAVITMDGIIKAGINIEEVTIKCDNINKVIIVKLPETQILSHELDESSMKVYDEETGLFNPITLEDSATIRQAIKEEAEENAINNGILKDAKEKAQTILQYIIESVPNVKGNYTIQFR